MKNSTELDSRNVLRYSKSLFTEKEVLDENRRMGTPEAWIFGEDKDNFYLSFSEIGYNYIQKHKENLPDFMRY